MANFNVKRLTPAIGGVVSGIDLGKVDDATFALIEEAWYEHLVLFFPQQHLEPAAHREIALRFGELEIHPHAEKYSDDLPEVCVLHSHRGGRADVWHADVTYTPSPPVAVMIQIRQGPEVGGDTMWSNQYLAFETLSEPIKDLLEGCSALHMSTIDADMHHEHPAVRVHPVTGKKALYLNRLFTRSLRQLRPGESQALMDELLKWSERPEFSCRWSWQVGDMALWDNRCALHYAVNDYSAERMLHRCMILGDAPTGPGPRWEQPDPGIASSSVGYEYRGKDPRGR